jgi:hypothetical protein
MGTRKPVSIADLDQLEPGRGAAIDGSAVEHTFPLSVYSSASP